VSAPLTVTRLARRFRLSRTTLLYYERVGILRASARSAKGYRLYSSADAERLRTICRLRKAGVSMRAIRRVLGAPQSLAEVLRARLGDLRVEIEALRSQQRFILDLLRTDAVHEEIGVMTKARWTQILRAAGFDDEAMWKWHADFERDAPDDHQRFLEFLCIGDGEIAAIRARSRLA
jgi:DNA-binding transcriptional MerR regulator